MKPLSDEELIAQLATVSGHLVTDPEILANWSRDWWSFTARLEDDLETAPSVGIVPDTASDIASIVRIATGAGRPIIIKGGGSAVTGAIEPIPHAILIDCRGLNVIEAINEIDGTVTVDAGVLGGELEAHLNDHGFTLGHDPESLHYSTVGGWLATRAVGLLSTRYGGIESLVAGISVVLADSSIVTSVALPRHGAGPRWLDFFLGSEGSLGIVTSATLRVWPLPEERRFGAWAVDEFEGAVEAIRCLIHRGIRPAAIRILDRAAAAGIAAATGSDLGNYLVIAMSEGDPAMVNLELMKLGGACSAIGARDLGAEPALAWYRERYRADWLLDANEMEGMIADRIDLAVPWSRLPALRAALLADLQPIVAQVSTLVTHVEHSGAMLAVTFAIEEEDDDAALEAYQSAWFVVMRTTLDHGGGIVHHTGIGQARLPWLAESLGSGSAIFPLLKRALDPGGHFNPGRLLS